MNSCLFFAIISAGFQPLIIYAQSKASFMHYIETEFSNHYAGATAIRWPALNNMNRRDMAKLCVRIHKMHTLINLGDLKSPTTTAFMATYMGKYIRYRTVNAKPQSIQVLRCGLDNMIFTKYRGPPLEPFLTFGGLDDDQAYILEERLDNYVYLVTKVYGIKERKRRSCFRCRTTNTKHFRYSTSDDAGEIVHVPEERIDELYERIVEAERQRKNNTQEYGSNNFNPLLSLATPMM